MIIPIKRILAWMLVCCSSGHLAGAQLSGRLIAGDTLRAIGGGSVLAFANRTSPAQRPVIYKSQAGSDGIYRFAALPAGNYQLCVAVSGDYLNPCQWSQPLDVTIASFDVARDIVLARGVPIAVVIRDPSGFVSQRALPSGLPPVSLYITDTTGKIRIVPMTRVEGGLQETIIPVGTPIQLTISSRNFLLADGAGRAVDQRGHSVALNVRNVSAQSLASTLSPSFKPRGRFYGATVPIRIRGIAPAR